jgi:Na+-driven multidrug efflux pump
MSLRRLAVPALVAWVVDNVFGYVVFGVMLQGEFARYPAVFRSFDAVSSMMPLMATSTLIGFFAVAYIFAKGHDGGSGLKEGFWFGVVLGSVMLFLVGLPSYVIYNIDQKLAGEMMVCMFLEFLIDGLALGLVYKPALAGASRAVKV